MRRGQEHRARTDQRQPERRGVIEVGAKEERVIGASVLANVVQQFRRIGALKTEEIHLIFGAVIAPEYLFPDAFELRRIPLALHTKAADWNAVDFRGAHLVFVFPRPIILCASGENLDVVVLVHPLGDELAGIFRASAYFISIPLDYDGYRRFGLGFWRLITHAARSPRPQAERSEEHTSELQSRQYLVCRLLL